jgi:hypothetical protein
MSDTCGTIAVEEPEAAGLSAAWAYALPVATYHTEDGRPYRLRDDLAPWLGEGGDT